MELHWKIIIWASGYVAAYAINRAFLISKFKKWTVGDRTFGLFVSVFSWIVVAVLLVPLLSSVLHDAGADKPAKW